MAAHALNILYSQWFKTPPPQTQSFAGQTVIVTGSNVGLGLEAARSITANGAGKVILAVRTVSKGEEAKKDIELTTKTSGIVEVWQLDLESYDSVKEFATKASSLDRIDVLLNNAGIATMAWKIAGDQEATIKVNVISTFLLSFLLLPKLRETASKYGVTPRLTIVSSEVHYFAKFNERKYKDESLFAVLADQSKANLRDRYNVSKLLEVFIVQQLVRQLHSQCAPEKYPVIINAINPGLCHSSLMRENRILGTIIKFVLHARSTEVGGRTLVNAASFGQESHGKYLSDCVVSPVSSYVQSAEGQKEAERTWSDLKIVLEKIQPGILKNLV